MSCYFCVPWFRKPKRNIIDSGSFNSLHGSIEVPGNSEAIRDGIDPQTNISSFMNEMTPNTKARDINNINLKSKDPFSPDLNMSVSSFVSNRLFPKDDSFLSFSRRSSILFSLRSARVSDMNLDRFSDYPKYGRTLTRSYTEPAELNECPFDPPILDVDIFNTSRVLSLRTSIHTMNYRRSSTATDFRRISEIQGVFHTSKFVSFDDNNNNELMNDSCSDLSREHFRSARGSLLSINESEGIKFHNNNNNSFDRTNGTDIKEPDNIDNNNNRITPFFGTINPNPKSNSNSKEKVYIDWLEEADVHCSIIRSWTGPSPVTMTQLLDQKVAVQLDKDRKNIDYDFTCQFDPPMQQFLQHKFVEGNINPQVIGRFVIFVMALGDICLSTFCIVDEPLSSIYDEIIECSELDEEKVQASLLVHHLKLVVKPLNLSVPIPVSGPRTAETLGSYYGTGNGNTRIRRCTKFLDTSKVFRTERFRKDSIAYKSTNSIIVTTVYVNLYAKWILRRILPTVLMTSGRQCDFFLCDYPRGILWTSFRLTATENFISSTDK